MKKSNIVTVIIILIIIALITTLIIFSFILLKNGNNEENSGDIFVKEGGNSLSEQENNEITNENSMDTNMSNDQKVSTQIPNGKPYTLSIINTEEKEAIVGDGEKAMIEYICVDDFKLQIPKTLKEVGYKISLTNNDTVIHIISNDKKYACKIARFSDVAPYKLTEEQENEFLDIYDDLAKKACIDRGISEDDENYYSIFLEEYKKIDSSNEKIQTFYEKYNIDKYTSFAGFTNEELENAWKLISVNPNNIGVNQKNDANEVSKITFQNGQRTSYQYEIGKGNLFENAFKGLFLQTEAFVEDDSSLTDYEVQIYTL